MRQDLAYALRGLRRQPGFALVTILTMALGIGATTTLFSVAYGVLAKPLPWADADRLMRLTESRKGQQGRLRGTISNGSYLAWRDAASTTAAIGGYGLSRNTMTAEFAPGGEPTRVQIGGLTPSMFDVLQVRPIRGRAFEPDDAKATTGASGPARVVILSYGLWHDVFEGRDDAVGRGMRLDEFPVTIVGVMPRGFAFPDRDTRAWIPMTIGGVLGDNNVRRMMIFGGLARLKPGVTPAQASSEATARARTAPDPGFTAVAMFGSSAPPDIAVTPAIEAMTAEVRPALLLLLVAVALLFVTATANVASLQLARAAARRREIAIRAAIGAGTMRLARQLIVESAVVGGCGALVGIVLAIVLHRALPTLLPADFPRVDGIALDWRVLLFAVTLATVASLACGLMPAWHARRVDLVEALSEDGSAPIGHGLRSATARTRALIMAGQVAVSCVLLVGASLLGRSFAALMRADRGYDPSSVLTARIDLPGRYDGAARVAFADAVVDRLRGTPGVVSVAGANALPFLTLGGNVGFDMPSPSNPQLKQQVQAITHYVHPSYAGALGLRLLQGRFIGDADTAASRPVIVVNRSFAARYLGASPIGMRVPMRFGEGRPDCDVVGVVDDVRQGDVTDAPAAEIFASYRQMPNRLVTSLLVMVVRTSDDPMTHVAALRTAVRERDPAIPIDSIMTMDERVETSLARPRLYAVVLAGFAGLAVAIAAVGLFGVLSYIVAQRSREIGVRAALGARPLDIVALVVRQVAVVSAAGIVVGLAAALALSRSLAAILYGVGPDDPLSFAIVPAVLIAVAAIAAIVPARRAARVDPLTVLR